MALPIAQSLRFWERSWAKAKANYKPEHTAVVLLSNETPSEIKQRIELEFAFSSPAVKTIFLNSVEGNFVDDLVSMKARYVLAVGQKLSGAHKRAARYLDIPFAEIRLKDVEPSSIETISDGGAKIRQLIERRNVIYLHKPNRAELGTVLWAFSETKRRYPDLLLLLSGVDEQLMKTGEYGLIFATDTDSKSKVQLSDVVYSESKTWLPDWAVVANLCVVLGASRRLDEMIEKSLKFCAAVVVYGVPKTASKLHDDLERIGAIWSIRRPQNLVAAFSQALEPEQTALTVQQAMEYFHSSSSSLSETIDNLIAEAS